MISIANGPLGANTLARQNERSVFTHGFGADSFRASGPVTYLRSASSFLDQVDIKYETSQQTKTRLDQTPPRSTITRYEFAGGQFSTIPIPGNPPADSSTTTANQSVDSIA